MKMLKCNFIAVMLLQINFAIAASLDNTTNLGTNPPIPLASGSQNVTRNSSGVYDFGDKDGDGTRTNAVVPVGLDLGVYNLYTVNSTNIALNLNGGAITGASPSAAFYTTHSDLYIGSGSISIRNVGTILAGAIDTHCIGSGENFGIAGSVTIGEGGLPVLGNIRVDSIYTYVDFRNNNNKGAGDVTVYSVGDVRIQTSSGTLGNITAYANTWIGGTIYILHRGAFAARNIDTRGQVIGVWSGARKSGDVTIAGNWGVSPSGTFSVNQIDTSHKFNGLPGNIVIRGYAGVNVTTGLLTKNTDVVNNYPGGNIDITNILGSIRISGVVETYTTGTGATSGYFNLQCGGSITVANMDLSKLRYASFNIGSDSFLTGLIKGTNGLAVTGIANIGTALRTPANTRLYYQSTNNPTLNKQVVRLASLSGAASLGGLLLPTTGSVPCYRNQLGYDSQQ